MDNDVSVEGSAAPVITSSRPRANQEDVEFQCSLGRPVATLQDAQLYIDNLNVGDFVAYTMKKIDFVPKGVVQRAYEPHPGVETVEIELLHPITHDEFHFGRGIHVVEASLAALFLTYKDSGTPLADRELREFKQRSKGSVAESFHYHLARLIEMLHAVERIAELAEDPELLGRRTVTRALLNRSRGIGSCEAPRGTLFHDYEVDETGLMVRANLLIATSQNNLAINRAVEQAARRFVNPQRVEEGMLNRVEAAVRCFDPCLSCSTHAMGQMPMIVDIRRTNGEVIQRIERR